MTSTPTGRVVVVMRVGAMTTTAATTATATTTGFIGNPEHRPGIKFGERFLDGQRVAQEYVDPSLPERLEDLPMNPRANDRVEILNRNILGSQIDLFERPVLHVEKVEVLGFCGIGHDR